MIENKYQRYIIWLSFITGTIYLSLLLLNLQGTPTGDEIGHYLISRDAIHTPLHILDLWGRTVNTLLYLIPAQFGLNTARFFSLILAFFTAFYTYKVSKLLQIKNAFLVPFFLWFQPWFADLSYLCLTQVPFSLLMIFGTYLYLKNHRIGAALVIGLLPLIRHEGIALSCLFSIYMFYKKNWHSAILVFLPLLLYNIVYYCFLETWPFVMYLVAKPNIVYGQGTWYHFLIRLPHPRAIGIPIMLLVGLSFIPIIQSLKKFNRIIEIGIWYFSYFLLHTAIFRFGLFASGGYKLFLLPIAPAIAILAVIGLEWVIHFSTPYLTQPAKPDKSFINNRNMYILICALCIIFTFVNVKPHPLSYDAKAISKAIEWIRQEELSESKFVSTNIWFYHFFPYRVPPVTLWEKFPSPSDMPVGTIVIWDNYFSDMWDLKLEIFISNPKKWSLLKSFDNKSVIIFQKRPYRKN